MSTLPENLGPRNNQAGPSSEDIRSRLAATNGTPLDFIRANIRPPAQSPPNPAPSPPPQQTSQVSPVERAVPSAVPAQHTAAPSAPPSAPEAPQPDPTLSALDRLLEKQFLEEQQLPALPL